jgi:hypothetical protein
MTNPLITSFCSGEIIQETLTLSGASPRRLRHPPIAMTTYELQPDAGNRNAPHPPTGGLVAQEGAMFYVKKMFSPEHIFLIQCSGENPG